MEKITETSKYLSQFDNELITIMHEQGSKLKAVKFLHEKKPGIPLREILSYCDQLQNIEYNSYQELVTTAINACKEINPDNPLNAAKALPDLFKMLNMLRNYVNDNFNIRGDNILKMCDTALESATKK